MKPKVGDYIKTIRNSAVGNNVIAKVRFINYEDRLGFGKFKIIIVVGKKIIVGLN